MYICTCVYAYIQTYIHTHFSNLRANFDGNKPLQVTHIHMFIYVYMYKCIHLIHARVYMYTCIRTYIPNSAICALISMDTSRSKWPFNPFIVSPYLRVRGGRGRGVCVWENEWRLEGIYVYMKLSRMYVCIMCMCGCVCVCMLVGEWMKTWGDICIYGIVPYVRLYHMHVWLCVCMYVCMYVCERVNSGLRVYLYIRINTYIHIYMYICVYTYINMYMYMHTYIYIYVYIHICIYI